MFLTPTRNVVRSATGTLPHIVGGTLAAALAVTALTVAGPVVDAAAHSELISADPTADSVQSEAPDAVTLTFGEDLRAEGAALVVTAPGDARVDANGSLRIDGAVMSVALQPITESGAYRVAYRVVSADGHPVTGEYAFTYQGPGSPASTASPTHATIAATSPTAAGPQTSDSDARWLLGAAALALVTFVVVVLLRRRRRA